MHTIYIYIYKKHHQQQLFALVFFVLKSFTL